MQAGREGRAACGVCVRAAGTASRDLAPLYRCIAPERPRSDALTWMCQFCWRLAAQCVQFLEQVQRSENLLDDLSNSYAPREEWIWPEYSIRNSETYNICDIDNCEEIHCETFVHASDESDSDNLCFNEYRQEEIKPDPDDGPFDANLQIIPKVKKRKHRTKKKPKLSDIDGTQIKLEPFGGLDDIKQEILECEVVKEPNGKSSREQLKREEEKLSQIEMELMMLDVEEQLKELESKKQSPKFVNAMYRCYVCAVSFNEKERFENHKLRHDKSSGHYVCAVCTCRFQTTKLLQAHARVHQRRWRCRRCGAVLSERQLCQAHYEKCSHKGEVQCDECGKRFQTTFRLRKHINISHKRAKQFTCDICEQMFKFKFQLRNHISQHTDIRPYECKLCGKTSKTVGTHQIHMKSHKAYVQSEESYCVECDRYYKSPHHLKYHLSTSLIHNSKTDFRHACLECPQRFACPSQLQLHINTVHLKRRSHACASCDKAYFSRGALAIHVKNKHTERVRSRDHVCGLCGKAFLTRLNLKNHIRAIHEKVRPFVCQLCPATFGFRAALFTHNKLKHKPRAQEPAAAAVE